MEARFVLRPQSDAGWLRLVRESPEAGPFHLPSWSKVISATYGFRASALLKFESGQAVVGIPVIEVANPLARRRLVALPFTDHCAPLVADGFEIGMSIRDWPGLEVRTALGVPGAGHVVIGHRHLLDLEPDSGAVFGRLHKNRIQRRVRRSRELGVTVTLGNAAGDLEVFYALHCETRRRQGVPVQPRRFIQNIWSLLVRPGAGFAVIARIGRRPIAAALYLAWNRRLVYKFGASDQAYWNTGANFLVHWTAMEWGCRNGCLQYDFGRTDADNEGLRAFKALWGADEVPLVYTNIGAVAPRVANARAGRALATVIRKSPTVVCRALGEVLYRYAA